MRYLFYFSIFLGTLTPMFFVSATVPVEAHGKFGWSVSATSLVGTTEPSTCPTGSMQEEFQIVDITTMNQVPVAEVGFTAFNFTTLATVDLVIGTGPTIGPICYNPATDGVAISIDGGSAYHEFEMARVWTPSPNIPINKHTQSTVYLVPKTVVIPADYVHVSPVNISTSTSPQYTIDVGRVPPLFGATGLHSASLFLSKLNSSTSVFENVLTKSVPLSGGVGIKTIPAQTMPGDGWYQWSYYLSLNGTNASVPGSTIIDQPTSGWAGYDWPFLYDTTPPVQSVTHTPSPVYETNQVQILGEASDALAGINKMVLYLDDLPVKTCSFASTQTAACSTTVGPFLPTPDPSYTPPRLNHSYLLVSTDGIGNISTSTLQTFTVLPTPLPNIVASSHSPANGYSVVDSVPSILFAGAVGNTSTTSVVEGGWADLEIDWDSNGDPANPSSPFDENYNAFNGSKLGAISAMIPGIPGTPPIAPIIYFKSISYEVLNPPIGTHRYRFTADVANELAESDENDNSSAWRTFTVASDPNQCTGVWPLSAQACSATPPSGSAPYMLVDKCSNWTNPSMCIYECSPGYIQNGAGVCTLTKCNDGIDNLDTEDVLIDMADPGCTSINDNDESDSSPVLSAVSRVVDEGDPITISWDTNNANEALCTLVGPGIVGNPLSPSIGDPETGSVTVNIFGLSTYTITCGVQSTTFNIELAPKGWDS